VRTPTTLGFRSLRFQTFFEFDSRGARLSTEIWAGTSTAIALSYIFIVNPTILAKGGFPASAAFFATVCASALATFAMGVWARLPFAVAPGLEMNAYVATTVVGPLGFSWQQALGLCFVSSLLMLVVTATRLRKRFIASLPTAMVTSLGATVGVFIALIALQLAGIVEYRDGYLSAVRLEFDARLLVLTIGVAVALIAARAAARFAALASIAAATAAAYATDVVGPRTEFTLSRHMLDATGALSLAGLVTSSGLVVVVVLFLLDFYGSTAKFIGLSANTSVLQDGRVPRLSQGLGVDGAASGVGALVGTTTLTTFVESGVGIRAGGRTGVTALVSAICMLAALPLAGVISYVPVAATAGALVLVAMSLRPVRDRLHDQTPVDRIALIIMCMTVVATFDLSRALLVGFAVYVLGSLMQRTRPNPYIVASTGLLTLGTVLQHA
jgi:AGZA family xanthine/uracil permease-like MFS transporter